MKKVLKFSLKPSVIIPAQSGENFETVFKSSLALAFSVFSLSSINCNSGSFPVIKIDHKFLTQISQIRTISCVRTVNELGINGVPGVTKTSIGTEITIQIQPKGSDCKT